MRLWSLHPKYLDGKGLVALWRESLLAQKVLSGSAPRYRNHPQLERFLGHPAPVEAIGEYLLAVWDEAARRNYRFDQGKILISSHGAAAIPVTDGQLRYEWKHLSAKLRVRNPEALKMLEEVDLPDPHPCFVVVPGTMEAWERPLAWVASVNGEPGGTIG